MQTPEFNSLKNKIVDVGLFTDEFVPDGQTKPLKYTKVIIRVVINGNVEDLRLTPDKTQIMLLRSLPDVDDNVLELYQNNEDK